MVGRIERRQFRRAPIDLPVEFAAKDAAVTGAGLAKDISVGGMFIQTEQPAAFGAEVVVRLVAPGMGDPLGFPATVRWTSPTGMGVQFGNLGARETYAVTELARLSGQMPRVG